MDPRAEVRARPVYLTLVVLCAAIGLAILFMAGVAVVIAPSVDAVESSVTSLLLAISLAISIGSILAARAVRRSFVTLALSASSRRRRVRRTTAWSGGEHTRMGRLTPGAVDEWRAP